MASTGEIGQTRVVFRSVVGHNRTLNQPFCFIPVSSRANHLHHGLLDRFPVADVTSFTKGGKTFAQRDNNLVAYTDTADCGG